MSETPRLIKQIAAATTDGSSDVFALADDGTLWTTFRQNGGIWQPWQQLPDIPEDDPPPDGASP